MGTQPGSLAPPQSRPRPGRTYFRRLFVWYFLGVVAIAVIVTGVLESAAILLVAWLVKTTALFTNSLALKVALMLALGALPCLVLFAAILLFAWRLERKIGQPVGELMRAVERIRQQDLNFSIAYQGRNELGDLCSAFNELRRELQESLEREWRKQEETRTLVAALAHDLRTPVTVIQGHIENLARTEVGQKRSERLERYLPVLEASSQRMTRLLNDMLLVSSVEQTSFIIEAEAVWLEEAMARKSSVYTVQAAAHEIEFTSTYRHPGTQTGQGTRVSIDLHRIEQVLDNVFENALRHTPAQGKINLVCTHELHLLTFVLQDTGGGIAPEALPHVFEKFYQARPQPSDKARQAVGLGLYICQLIVEKHGGTISIRNRPTGGCEVAFTVPTTSIPDG